MKIITTLFLIFFLNVSSFSAGKVTGGASYNIPSWFKNSFLEIAEDASDASADNKHLMLFFHLKDCPYCEKMLQDFQKNKDFISANFDVIAINIKGDREIEFNDMESFSEKTLAQNIGVKYTPTIVFIDKNNTIVARTNGYRSPQRFAKIMDFVRFKKYQTTDIASYIESLKQEKIYSLKANKLFTNTLDLSLANKKNKLLAVILENNYCDACDYLHNTTLKNKDVLKQLAKYTIVRLDSDKDTKIIAPDGKNTTIKDFVKNINITYRPAIILFNNGEEKARIDGFLYTWHLSEMLRFVANNLQDKFASYGQYLAFRQQELIKQGIDIDLKK